MNSQRTLIAVIAFTLVATVLVVAAFSYEFVVASLNPPTPTPGLTETTYMDQVEPLLAMGNVANGEAVAQQFSCVACHVAGAANGVAPSWEGIAENAATRRPPLTAAAYLYESITQPSVFVMPPYANSMPANYGQRMSEQQLADLLVYLLAQ
jgi:cytochrome c551/c552